MCEHAAVPSSSDIGKVRTKEGPVYVEEWDVCAQVF